MRKCSEVSDSILIETETGEKVYISRRIYEEASETKLAEIVEYRTQAKRKKNDQHFARWY